MTFLDWFCFTFVPNFGLSWSVQVTLCQPCFMTRVGLELAVHGVSSPGFVSWSFLESIGLFAVSDQPCLDNMRNFKTEYLTLNVPNKDLKLPGRGHLSSSACRSFRRFLPWLPRSHPLPETSVLLRDFVTSSSRSSNISNAQILWFKDIQRPFFVRFLWSFFSPWDALPKRPTKSLTSTTDHSTSKLDSAIAPIRHTLFHLWAWANNFDLLRFCVDNLNHSGTWVQLDLTAKSWIIMNWQMAAD